MCPAELGALGRGGDVFYWTRGTADDGRTRGDGRERRRYCWHLAALGLWTTPAGAQWGPWVMGWGWGGFGGFNYTSSPTDFLNQQAMSRASRAGARPRTGPTPGNPNAYYNRIRDNGFVPRYDVQVRRTPAERPHPPASLGQEASRPAAAEATAASRPKPTIPLSSFFDADHGWPSGPVNLRSRATSKQSETLPTRRLWPCSRKPGSTELPRSARWPTPGKSCWTMAARPPGSSGRGDTPRRRHLSPLLALAVRVAGPGGVAAADRMRTPAP